MFSRHRTLLRLIENEGGAMDRLRLVKLAFLLAQSRPAPGPEVYSFLPYKRGPFSFTLYHELSSLTRDGWLQEQGHTLQLARPAAPEIARLDHELCVQIDALSSLYRPLSTSALIDNVYLRHPWVTINADFTHKRRAPRPIATPAVYTVGYEGIMVDALLDRLLHNGIARLIDVRANPIARRYGFHKSTLTKLCANVGIEYIHFPSLGIPGAWRASLSDFDSYQRLFDRYEKEILPERGDSIGAVASLIASMPSALMCMEADHHSCHRSRLANTISDQLALPIVELCAAFEKGANEPNLQIHKGPDHGHDLPPSF